MKDFYGEWQYKETRYILHEDGTLEVFNLDSIFIFFDDYHKGFNNEYNIGTWYIRNYGKERFESPRIYMQYDSLQYYFEFFIESDDKLIYYIGDPDDWNRAVIRKVKPN